MLLNQTVPTADQALDLSVEELAYAVLRHLQPAGHAPTHAGNRFNELVNIYDPPLDHRMREHHSRKDELRVAIAEAWSWLLANGLTATVHDGNYTNIVVTRRGLTLNTAATFHDFQKTTTLRREALHPTLQAEAWLLFVRGKHDLAIFEAYKQVEVAVRDAGDFDHESFGVPLMREAYDKADGPLTDMTLPENERLAIAHLFSGAIGAFKNPNSHRVVGLDDAGKAAELLMLASHLLRMTDEAAERKARKT